MHWTDGLFEWIFEHKVGTVLILAIILATAGAMSSFSDPAVEVFAEQRGDIILLSWDGIDGLWEVQVSEFEGPWETLGLSMEPNYIIGIPMGVVRFRVRLWSKSWSNPSQHFFFFCQNSHPQPGLLQYPEGFFPKNCNIGQLFHQSGQVALFFLAWNLSGA